MAPSCVNSPNNDEIEYCLGCHNNASVGNSWFEGIKTPLDSKTSKYKALDRGKESKERVKAEENVIKHSGKPWSVSDIAGSESCKSSNNNGW